MSKNGVEIAKIAGDDADMILTNLSRTFTRFNGTVVHDKLAERLDEILNMNISDDDVWVCSFPKAGTTWTQEMVWCIANDLDYCKAKIPLSTRYIFLDMCFILNEERLAKLPNANEINVLLSPTGNHAEKTAPRYIKTHLPFDLLPKKLRDGSTNAKIIYVTRNPRDACISAFHHRKMMGVYKGDMETYCDLFIKGLVTFGPYWKHLFSYWNHKNFKNRLFIKYEDMKMDLPSVVNRTAQLFDKKFGQQEMKTLCDHLSFDSMKHNTAVNADSLTALIVQSNQTKDNGSFIRKGASDQWKNELSESLNSRFEKWEKANLEGTNLTYANM